MADSALAQLIAGLRAAVGADAVLTGGDVTARAASWIDPAPLQAAAIVRPRTTEQMAAALRVCHDAGQPVITVGGATNLVDATRSSADDVLLSLERMHAVEAIDAGGQTMTVQAGAPLEAVQHAAAQAGLLFPLDLAARGSATIGGCAAMNAGGVRVLRYGVMRDLVLGVEAVLADGTVISSLNRMLKNNAGYDLKQLFIGSEGTLGVITRLVLRLYPRQPYAATALLAADTFEQVVELRRLLQTDLGGALASYEVMWPHYYRLTTTPPAPSKPPLAQDYAYYVLAEALGASYERLQDGFTRAIDHGYHAGLISNAVVAGSKEQRARLWRVREDSEQIERQHHLTFGYDVSLPLAEMEEYAEDVLAGVEYHFGTAARCWIYGHLADGNLHVNVWAPELTPADRETVAGIVYRPLRFCGGSISAEHGIGLEKKAYLSWSRTPEELALMRQLKFALDPQCILNRGRVFDV
jgi:FAD/FMN-containing dehydrogenase